MLFLLPLFLCHSQTNSTTTEGLIKNNNQTKVTESDFLKMTHVDINKNNLPYYLEHQTINGSLPSFKITNTIIRELTQSELKIIEPYKQYITNEFSVTASTGKSRTETILYQKIIPLKLNVLTNKYEYLESYSPSWDNINEVTSTSHNKIQTTAKTNAANTSVLSTGKWYKIGLTKEGVYKINKSFLASLGIDVNLIDPRNIRLYGNGGKLLPEKNSEFRYDDLQENSITVIGENDGIFHDTDYVMFYGQSTDSWKHINGSNMPFEYQMHYFSDTSFYFITTDLGVGKRIPLQSSIPTTPNNTTGSQDYFGYHELNQVNLVKSGREFYGEKFDLTTSYSFYFNIPDVISADSVYVKAGVLSRCDGPITSSTYHVNFNGNIFAVSCATTNTTDYLADVGHYGENQKGGILGSNVLSISVSKQTSQAVGWLDKIIYNCRRNLIFNQVQYNYRDRRVISGPNTFAKYIVTNNTTYTPIIWDVTNPLDIKKQDYIVNGNAIEYISSSDSLREYCIFTSKMAYAPKAYGAIANQNLHSVQQADFVIVAYPEFMDEANRIAKIHQQYDSLTYVVVSTEQVYNEFSSGTPDIGGIRDFVKMLYKRPINANEATRYLLLFGDGSYKNKDINLSGNSALIPTYQTQESASFTNSYASDDYFAMMDDSEGDLIANDIVDIGVGRFPVRNKAEAIAVTNKVEHYYKRNYAFNPNVIESSCITAENDFPQGNWRNWVCFIADDEDGNGHLGEANGLATSIYNGNKSYNVDKIYLDSYLQYSTPGGDRYPDAVNDINQRMEKGALIVNYTGHGGELGLAEERIVEVSQILNWKNKNNMPLMVTATCEFSRFDDPDRTSAGEYCLLNEQGGAIGLITTVRVAYSNFNLALNTAFYHHALNPMANGKMPHIGDLYRLTKTDIGFTSYYLNFVILGDPALKLSYPENKIYTSTINSHSVNSTSNDTLSALSKITIIGYVGDKFGNKMTNFNGVVYPTVFDKETTVTTLGNDPNSIPTSFLLQKNMIYNGKSEVVNGDFHFSFLVPKDISYNYGKGKISYYAHNGINDAAGYCDKITIGGTNSNAVIDNQGPTINLFMNNEKFVRGGLTNENPKIHALVSDSSGINTIGTGIGHDIVAVLDENTNKQIVLNDFYSSDLNTYQKGKINYPFSDLPEGNHQLTLKVWDVQNNSSTVHTDFVVAKQAELALTHVLNYPNPFTTKTNFYIEHNQCCITLRVMVQIYTITGKVVKSLNKVISSDGFRSDGIEWDGKDEYGDKLARGVYIYKVSVTDPTNKKTDKIEKLVILN